MRGPILSRILGDKDDSEEINSVLLNKHRDRILDQLDKAGGCCGTFEAAEAVRREGQEYR